MLLSCFSEVKVKPFLLKKLTESYTHNTRSLSTRRFMLRIIIDILDFLNQIRIRFMYVIASR